MPAPTGCAVVADREPLYVCATPPWLSGGKPSGLPVVRQVAHVDSVAKRVMSQANAWAMRSMCAFVMASKYGSPPLYVSAWGTSWRRDAGAMARRRARRAARRRRPRTASPARAATSGAGRASAARAAPAAPAAGRRRRARKSTTLLPRRFCAAPPPRLAGSFAEHEAGEQQVERLHRIDDLGQRHAARAVRQRLARLGVVVADAERDAGHARGSCPAPARPPGTDRARVLAASRRVDAAAGQDRPGRVVTVGVRQQIDALDDQQLVLVPVERLEAGRPRPTSVVS